MAQLPPVAADECQKTLWAEVAGVLAPMNKASAVPTRTNRTMLSCAGALLTPSLAPEPMPVMSMPLV